MKKKKNIHEHMIVDIIHTGNMLESIVNRSLKKNELTNAHYNILRILKGAIPEPLSVGEIKNRMVFTNSDTTRLIDRMIKKEIVTRKICSQNRRKMDITITKKGLVLLEKSSSSIQNALNHFFADDISEQKALQISNSLLHLKSLINELNEK